MPTFHSRTHYQAPRTNAKTKACQRVCLFERTGNYNTEYILKNQTEKSYFYLLVEISQPSRETLKRQKRFYNELKRYRNGNFKI